MSKQPDRTTPPESKPFHHIPFPKYTSRHLSNGIEVHFLPFGEVGVLEFQAIFRAGKNFLPIAGLGSYTTRMMQEGSQRYSSLQLSQQLDTYGAWINVEQEEEATAFKLATTTPNAPFTLPLLKEILLHPRFPAEEFDQMKQRGLHSARINFEKTTTHARRNFAHQLFGASHPYGLHTGPEEIEKLDLNQVIQYHEDWLFPANMSLAVVGKFEEAEIMSLMEEEFGQLKLSRTPIEEVREFPYTALNQGGRRHISLGGMQSTVRLGHLTVKRSHPDYYRLAVVSTILGGYFGSRLMSNIREEKGYTYGIYAGIAAMKHEGVLIVQGDVGNEYVEATIKEVKKEMKRLQEEEIGEEELSLVKNYLLGKSISERESPFQMGDWLRFSLVNGISFEELDRRFEVIRKLKREEVPELASRYFNPEDMLEVVAGA